MADVKDMYRMTKFVNSPKYYYQIIVSEHPTRLEANDKLAELYAKKYSYLGLDKTKAIKLVNRTESNGYIRVLEGDKETVYDVTDSGFHLIGKSYYFFRTGLWDETLKRYDKIQTIAIVILVAIISGLAGALGKFIIEQYE